MGRDRRWQGEVQERCADRIFISERSAGRGQFVFPLFTDWKELREWKGVFDDNHPPKTMIFTFPSVLSMLKENHTGLLINGFGKSPLVIPMAMIEKITSLDAYQREFVKKEPMPSGDESAAHSKQ